MQISGVTIQGGVNLIPPGAGAGGGAPSVSFGYSSGGYAPTSPAPTYVDNIIQKFSFSSDGNATDVGDLTVGRKWVSGQSSSVSGYTSGGMTGIPSPDDRSIIDKFPFASDGNATDVGDLTIFFSGYGRIHTSGQSSADNGYVSGGTSNNYEKSVDKFPFSSDANATDMGDLIETLNTTAGQSSADNGYVSGGKNASAGSIDVNIIQKFPFASDSNATDVGDLTIDRSGSCGQSSSVSGYTSGGVPGPVDTIDKFPFASDSNATDVGDLLNTKGNGSGQSSSVSGYVTGGGGDPSSWNMIQKFSFTTDGNSTDVGDLLGTSFHAAGQQG